MKSIIAFKSNSGIKCRGLLLAAFLVISGSMAHGQFSVDLGAASSFGVLGATTVTNTLTGQTVINGDLGLAPGTSITGFGPGIVNGVTHINDTLAQQAQADAMAAFVYIGTLSAEVRSETELSSVVYTPGVYSFASSADLDGVLTLNGAGTYIFKIGSTFITTDNASVNFINGATADDLFFSVGSSATLGVGSEISGTILASSDITANTGAEVNDGRLLALTGAVTLDSNTITVVPEPSSAIMVFAGIIFFLRGRTRRSALAS